MTLNEFLKREPKSKESVSEGSLLETAYQIVGDGVARADIEKLVKNEGFQRSVARLRRVQLQSKDGPTSHRKKD